MFLEFWSDREAGRVYAPEDWRVWIGESGTGRGPRRVVAPAAWPWRRCRMGVAGSMEGRQGEPQP